MHQNYTAQILTEMATDALMGNGFLKTLESYFSKPNSNATQLNSNVTQSPFNYKLPNLQEPNIRTRKSINSRLGFRRLNFERLEER